MRIWRTVSEVTEPVNDTSVPTIARLSISGLVMRLTYVARMGKADHHTHEYAPVTGWNGKWMTLAEAERVAGRHE